MRIRTIFLNSAAVCTLGLFCLGNAAAAASPPEMASRVKLSGVPDEKVSLRSNTAPVTRIDLAPSASQLEIAARSDKFAPVPGLAALLGIKPPPVRGSAPMRVGSMFPSGVEATVAKWEPIASGGFVTHFRITSAGAKGIRAKLLLPPGLTTGELRVIGHAGEDAQRVPLSVVRNGEIWTPPTDGPTQVVELFTMQPVEGLRINVTDVGHFDQIPYSDGGPTEPSQSAAGAGTCTVDVACPIGDDPVNGNAIGERRRSVARMSFSSGGGMFTCTGTLINSPSQQDFFLTANHCISTQAEALSLTTRWFYEASACLGLVRSDVINLTGGAQLVFTNQFVDSTLLRLNSPPPAGSIYAGWNASALPVNSAIVSLSHPRGDLMKAAFGTVSVPGVTTGLIRLQGYEQQMYGILFTRGIIEQGSSGSGLFTLSGGSLQLRGVLSSSTLRNGSGGLSCTNTNENANYGRFDYLYPQIASILNGTAPPADDFVNQPGASITALTFDVPKTATLNYVGDIDTFRINVAQTGTLYLKSGGGYDLIGGLLDVNGETVSVGSVAATNDDADVGSNDFGITAPVTPGTYYLNVAPWVPTDLTPAGYSVTASFTTASTNYTSLWWAGEAESGWGMNLNHQGNIIFGTLFTYDAGQGIWLILSRGERQADGSYTGLLYRTTGPAFNANPFTPITGGTEVGSMRLVFSGPDAGTLTYNVGSRSVTKSITKQTFATQPTCKFSGTNRTFNNNYQDLWWNPNESGWGINLTHQSDIIFGTLFTYDAAGKGMWLILSRGDRIADTQNFAGDLFRTTGPNFDAVPFTPITKDNLTKVGTMRLEFADGNTAKLIYDVNGASVTKNIQRQVFDTFRPDCQKP
ncbi:MAG: S1 family peptidase [Burkholderiales bacterium]|nr:S1 family peptidase [Burkholderiales bacterium]